MGTMWALVVDPTAQGRLARLARLVTDGALKTHIEVEAPWTDAAVVARRLLAREFPGKAVLRVGADG